MKRIKLAVTASALILLSGCAGIPVNETNITPKANTVQLANVGDVFYSKESLTGEDNHHGAVFNGDAYKYTLTVFSASPKKIGLQYDEYLKPVAGPYGGYRINEGWLIKSSFTKKFEYDLTDQENTISYKDLRFKILGVKGGTVKYMLQ